MSLNRTQLIIIGAAAFVILIFIGIFTGLIPGLRPANQKPPQVTLTVWGIEDKNFFADNISAYQKLRPNVQVNYVQANADTYEDDLINALAAGQGPDVLMIKNTWLPKHYAKLAPVADSQLTLVQLQQLFPSVVEQDFAPDKIIYALPLYIDTLALYYNRDIFDTNGIALAPGDWLGFQNLIPKLRQVDSSGKLIRAAAAIGGSSKSVDTATDLLSLLMLQSGTQMTDSQFTSATFAGNVNGALPGLDALTFYTKFSDPANDYHTWDDNFGYSLDTFSQGKTVMMFNYQSETADLQNRNPVLKFKVSAMPQPNLNDPAVNFASYWGLAVSNRAKNPDWAWDFILYLTTNDSPAETYLKASGHPPALRSLIQKYVNDPDLGVFAKQALSARSWPEIDEKSIANIFSQMISAVIAKQLDAQTALSQAERQVSDLMQAKRGQQ